MDKKVLYETARSRMAGCHVCPECNGQACKGMIPGFGGLRTGRSFTRNYEALQEYGLIMRSMAGVEEPDTSAVIFGKELALPVLAAPVGGIALNAQIAGLTPEEAEKEYDDAVTTGSVAAGTLAMTGDGGQPYMFDSGLCACRVHPGRIIPTIKPRDDEAIIAKAKLAQEAGAPAFACDIDAATLINMRIFGQPVGPKSAASIQRIAAAVPIPFIVKGIMSPEEALACVEAGAKGIVVSNHGGRILDGMAGTADVLPEIAAAVKGKITIFVDGGIRHGEDVLKMLALGADACLIGRPVSIGAIGGGAEGVEFIFKTLQSELRDAMMITGTANTKSVSANILKKVK